MDLNPPAGSKISIVSDGADPRIIIPATGSFTRYLALARLLAQRYSLPQVLATPAPTSNVDN